MPASSGLDLARGLAVVSMVIAHIAPWGGVFVETEYLTAPWFALLIGISLLLAWEKLGGRAGVFLLANLARGVLLMDAAREWLVESGSAGGWVGRVVSWGAAGAHYRVTTFVAIAAAGIAAAPSLLEGRAAGRRGLVTAGALLMGAALAIGGGRLSPLGADAYSGTWPEIVGVILLSLSATWFCAWLVDALGEVRKRWWVGAVVNTGRMAFTAR